MTPDRPPLPSATPLTAEAFSTAQPQQGIRLTLDEDEKQALRDAQKAACDRLRLPLQ